MDVATGLAIVKDAVPEVRGDHVETIEEGWDSLVLDIDGEWVARFPRFLWGAEKFEHEGRVLPILQQALSVPVPSVRALVRDGNGTPICQVYPKLPGRTLDPEVESRISTETFAGQLGGFLTELHELDPAHFVAAGLASADREKWLARWRRLASGIEVEIVPLLDERSGKGAVEFLATHIDKRLVEFEPAFIHGDLGGWNILVDEATSSLAAVIDWGEAEIADPAFDFSAIKAEHGAVFENVLATYDRPVDDAFRQRIDAYAGLHVLFSALFARRAGRTEFLDRYLELARTVWGG